MKLKVGMYVRTKNGISKIIGFTKNYNPNYFHLDRNIIDEEDYLGSLIYCYKFYENQILKASNSIIDLIEVGDYVNGVEVEEINDKEIMLVDTHLWIDKEVANRLIKSIVTKEQFESMKYVVEK